MMETARALFPTAYFPSIALTAAMLQSGTIVIEQQESFPKQTHRNRTVILTANGPMTLSVPVVRCNGSHTRTADIDISYAEHWNLIHWRAMEAAYNSSPFFLYYRDGIEHILMQKYDRLIELNEALLKYVFTKLKAPCAISYTNNYAKPNGDARDYRDRFSYKHPERLPYCPRYEQVFSDRMPFNSNVGILDLLFNLGPESKEYLSKITI